MPADKEIKVSCVSTILVHSRSRSKKKKKRVDKVRRSGVLVCDNSVRNVKCHDSSPGAGDLILLL